MGLFKTDSYLAFAAGFGLTALYMATQFTIVL